MSDELLPDTVPARDIFFDSLGYLQYQKRDGTRINTMTDLTRLVRGFCHKEFSILCGSTGVGKTTFLANWAAALLYQRTPFFVVSAEIGPTQFCIKMLSCLLNKDLHGLNRQLKESEAEEITKNWEPMFNQAHTWFAKHERKVSVETIICDIEWHLNKHKTEVVFIDNLNYIMDVTSADKQVIEMDRVVSGLIDYVRHRPIHLVMVCHPRKTIETRVESEYDIKGSSTAVQEAHNVFLLNRPHPDRIKAGGAVATDRELKIAKMRYNGQCVGYTVLFGVKDGVVYTEKKVLKP